MRTRITLALPWLALTSVVSLLASVVVLLLPVTAVGAPVSSEVQQKRYMDDAYNLGMPPRTYEATVTVSQATDLVRQKVKVTWRNLRPSTGTGGVGSTLYPVVVMQCWGTPAEITQQTCWNAGRHTGTPVNQSVVDPGPFDKAIFGGNPSQSSSVPFKARDDGKLYNGYQNDVGWSPGEVVKHNPTAYSPATQNAIMPDLAEGFTNRTQWYGETDIELLTEVENPHLGCSSTAACSLVVIPIGDPRCKPDRELPQDLRGTCARSNTRARSAENWITPTNWSRRFAFPLSFRDSRTCQMDNRQETGFAGSFYAFRLLNNSWRTKFCNDKDLFRLGYAALPDGEARSQFRDALSGTWQDGSTNALLTSRPMSGDPPKPVVYAPVALTGVAVSFVMDDENGREVTQLNLNARLLAKMITQSYGTTAASQHPVLKNNPTWWGKDPEFLALNPPLKNAGIPFPDREGSAYPVISLGDLDAIHALTSYILADKDAVAWLKGAGDGYGMVVNPKFYDYQLPVGSLELRDDFVPTDDPNNPFYKQNLLSAHANVADNLYNAAIAVAQSWPYAKLQPFCADNNRPETCGLKRVEGRQLGGHRALLAITTLGDSTMFGLRQASLASAGGSFVKPGEYSLALALRATKLDEKTGVLSADFAKLHPLAYPGLSVVYAAIPTTGLSATTASNYATFLDYAAGPGQIQGVSPGQLPGGYLPLSEPMRQQTRDAAVAVREQKGAVPAPPPGLSTDPAAGLLPPPGSEGRPNDPSPGGGNQAPAGGTPAGTSSAPGAGSPGGSSTPSAVRRPMTSVAIRADSSSLASWVLQGVLGLGVLVGVVAFGVTIFTQRQHPLRRALRAVLRRS